MIEERILFALVLIFAWRNSKYSIFSFSGPNTKAMKNPKMKEIRIDDALVNH
ncbi:hypothetical protein SDC9_163246 [bioreactor metagenome]|uniref:Uncharacterized protein n=1 Tax=bioreactor metagenome TaxID=1076179 RepID=A0A645FPM3_9ZZZZ